jgi:hypothetical protein
MFDGLSPHADAHRQLLPACVPPHNQIRPTLISAPAFTAARPYVISSFNVGNIVRVDQDGVSDCFPCHNVVRIAVCIYRLNDRLAGSICILGSSRYGSGMASYPGRAIPRASARSFIVDAVPTMF